MTIRKILTAPHDLTRLQQISMSVRNSQTKDSEALIQDLIDTCNKHKSLGLAAPQIGVFKRVFVVDLNHTGRNEMIFINPCIIRKERVRPMLEGCESFPGAAKRADRADRITVQYEDKSGKKHTREFAGMLAQVIQHETDHLNGDLLFADSVEYYRHKGR